MCLFMQASTHKADKDSTLSKLLAAATKTVRQKGYAATSVDDICRAAGVSKGAFFHYFASKEDLAVAAADAWRQDADHLFATAPHNGLADPLDRILAYIDFRRELIAGRPEDFSCYAGTLLQESFASSEVLRKACASNIVGHAKSLEADIEAAMRRYNPAGKWTAPSLALHIQAVLQGAFVVAKATDDACDAIESVNHLHAYVRLLFGSQQNRGTNDAPHSD